MRKVTTEVGRPAGRPIIRQGYRRIDVPVKVSGLDWRKLAGDEADEVRESFEVLSEAAREAVESCEGFREAAQDIARGEIVEMDDDGRISRHRPDSSNELFGVAMGRPRQVRVRVPPDDISRVLDLWNEGAPVRFTSDDRVVSAYNDERAFGYIAEVEMEHEFAEDRMIVTVRQGVC